MAATDHPLKRLVSTFITEFASWLLSAPVRAVRPLNIELPRSKLRGIKTQTPYTSEQL